MVLLEKIINNKAPATTGALLYLEDKLSIKNSQESLESFFIYSIVITYPSLLDYLKQNIASIHF